MSRPNLWFCRVLFFCTRAMGAASSRPSLRPRFEEGKTNCRTRVRMRREDVDVRLEV